MRGGGGLGTYANVCNKGLIAALLDKGGWNFITKLQNQPQMTERNGGFVGLRG